MGKQPRHIWIISACIAVLACIAVIQSAGYLRSESKVQGWTGSDRHGWYWASQGSRLVPETWFKALEKSGTNEPFSSVEHLTSFGFLEPPGGGTFNMPIGFAIDKQADDDLKVTRLRWYEGQSETEEGSEPWVGLNCAACHTGKIKIGGQETIIEGGPSLIDFQSFIESFDGALEATLADPAKFARFSSSVLGDDKKGANNEKMLKDALKELVAWQQKTSELNGSSLRYGFGRVDAFGHIYNKIILFSRYDPRPEGELTPPAPITNLADAPVSFPFLWNIHRQKQVQWNGIARNMRFYLGPGGSLDYGALGRNAGEVIGVFGEVVIKPPSGILDGINGLQSSVDITNLDRLESLVNKLKPPAWPRSIEAIVDEKLARGEELYNANCAGCHKHTDAVAPDKPTEVMIQFSATMGTKNQTDIWMACNAFTYTAETEQMKGIRTGFISGEPLPKVASVATILSTAVKGVLLGKKGEIIGAAANTFIGADPKPIVELPEVVAVDRRQKRREICEAATKDDKLLAYKARPLDGIWATAPYLHNGSVPTLYHLLSPAAKRPKKFWVGGRKYNAEKVGYVWDKPTGAQAFEFDTSIEGNSNGGHEYGVGKLTDDGDRMALIEFLKTL